MLDFESHMQIANRCAPCKISNGAAMYVLQELQYLKPKLV
jgi:hypothetical protein